VNPAVPTSLRSFKDPDRPGLITDAVRVLSRDGLVVIPTETVYGLAANAASAKAVAKLAAATAASRTPFGPVAWHAPSRELVLELIEPEVPLQRRLLSALLPGPVTFLVELPPDRLNAIRHRLGIAPSIVDDGHELCIRVPDHAATRELLSAAWKARMPLITPSIAAAGWGDGSRLPTTPGDQAELIIDDGPTRYRKPSTRIRLAGASFAILSDGALEERAVRKAMERTILFVCSGNTCRSPMAAAIAKSLISVDAAEGLTNKISSAGSSAGDGDPMTPESAKALKAMGIDVKGDHQSRGLTRQMISDADVVYTMTAQHARQVRSMDSSAADKIKLLDPDGNDVPDPIGASQAVYTRTAERLRELIRKRLAELGP